MFKRISAALVAGMMLLGGCSLSSVDLAGGEPVPAHVEITMKAAAQFATLKYVRNDQARANSVVRVASSLAALVQGDAVASLEELEAELRKQVDFSKLAAEDVILINALTDLIKIEAQRLFKEQDVGLENEAYKSLIVKILGWVSEAASLRMV